MGSLPGVLLALLAVPPGCRAPGCSGAAEAPATHSECIYSIRGGHCPAWLWTCAVLGVLTVVCVPHL
jgi:hypothetical protein